MSYDIELKDPVSSQTLELESPHFMRGGTYAVGGTRLMELNVTYNYASHFVKVLGEQGIRTIYGLSGAASIPLLKAAIAELGNDTGSDYWQPTEGNAKKALLQLLALAEMRPDGIWAGD